MDIGTRIGAYEVIAKLGEGGMGEVYRARDTRLNRDVALKTLPATFANDPDRLLRFTREAHTLAALNHPHIAQVYGVEESGDLRALAMEFVDGDDLSKVIARGPIPVNEALVLARQIIDALEAAHDKGIVHRDLKPANIVVTPEGQAKVLDFGLAKAMDPSSGSRPPSPGFGATGRGGESDNSPTITSPAMTQAGVILGTAAYMSPEQAKGRDADKRSDIWAFGCVLYEMLTGGRAFKGDDVSDTLVAVLRDEPDWKALPSATPANVRDILERCLEKDRKARLPDIAVARYMLDDISRVALPPSRGARATPITLAGAAALIAASVGATYYATRPASVVPARPLHFSVTPPGDARIAIPSPLRDLAISPDGSRIVFQTGTQSEQAFYVRSFDQLESTLLGTLVRPTAPFFSPDSAWIGYQQGGGAGSSRARLFKVSAIGGPPVELGQLPGGGARGAAWGPDGTIVLATGDPSTGLLEIPENGGEPKVLTKPDPAKGEGDHMHPSFLPNGKVLFTIVGFGVGENNQIAVLDRGTGAVTTVLRGGSSAEYVSSGHLVYIAAGSLRAVRFDPDRLQVLSSPVPIVDRIVTKLTGAADYAVSRDGTLIYVAGLAANADPQHSLVWVDRNGHEELVGPPPRAYQFPRLSPDGTRIALDIRDEQNDIWIWDIARKILTRLTDDPGLETNPVWSPDGQRVAFSSDRAKPGPGIFWQPSDGTGSAELLSSRSVAQTVAQVAQNPRAFTTDGRLLLSGNEGLSLLRPGGKTELEPLVATTGGFNVEVSPDGKWLAYQSIESGRPEIHVRPFPNVNAGHWQISNGYGTKPVWSRDGRELFYLDANNLLMSVPVQAANAFTFGNPVKILNTAYYATPNGRTYDVSLDGQKFVMIKAPRSESGAPNSNITVVVNWFEELKARVP